MSEDISYHSYTDAAAEGDRESLLSESNGQPPSVPPSVQRIRVGDLGTVEVFDYHKEGDHHEVKVDEDVASSVDEDYDVRSLASSIEDQLTCRGRMQVALHSNTFHFFIIALIILDILIVLFELFLDVGAFRNIVCPVGDFREQMEFCHFHEDTRGLCVASPRLIIKNQTVCALSPEVECKCGYRGGRRVCIPSTESVGVDPALILHSLSLFILSTFVVEVLLKLLAFRLKYFTHKFEVFDGVVVIISWTLDVASLIEEEAFQAASLLIILRLWRVVRVINGSILSSMSRSNAELSKARIEAKRIIHALHKAQDKIDSLQQENANLKKSMEAGAVRTETQSPQPE